jgi:1-acyl-sn-glycerol-3-phosphate acyltransferase
MLHLTNMMGDTDFSAYDSDDVPYSTLAKLAGFLFFSYSMLKVHEYSQRLEYEDTLTRYTAGVLQLVARTFHMNNTDSPDITSEGKNLFAIVPHRTSWEGIAVAANMRGNPPQFLVNTSFNNIPGVESFLKLVKAIPVEDKARRTTDGRAANLGAVEAAIKALENNGSVAIFPQGGFARIGEPPKRIFSGTARIAIETNTPIRVIRLDGFWSLENSLISQSIRNNRYYRFFFSTLHPNRVRTTECFKIDFHLANPGLSLDEKIFELNAQLYAFAKYTKELSKDDLENIKTEIAQGEHREIWQEKCLQYEKQKNAAPETNKIVDPQIQAPHVSPT